MSLISPALAGGLFTPSSTWEACFLEALSVILNDNYGDRISDVCSGMT